MQIPSTRYPSNAISPVGASRDETTVLSAGAGVIVPGLPPKLCRQTSQTTQTNQRLTGESEMNTASFKQVVKARGTKAIQKEQFGSIGSNGSNGSIGSIHRPAAWFPLSACGDRRFACLRACLPAFGGGVGEGG
ncbi:MAG: hypothetical protein WEB00_13295 [Dehalococcoidia bacterium]